jgi:hypothetical protein
MKEVKMLSTILSIVLAVIGIVLIFTLATWALKIIGIVLLVAAVIWMIQTLRGRRGTTV